MKLFSILLTRRTLYILAAFSILFFTAIYTIRMPSALPASISKDQLTTDLRKMFETRDKAALAGNPDSVKYMFDTSSKLGRWAFEHEKKRAAYLTNWSIIRKTKFVGMESDIRIQRVREKNGSIWIDFLHSGKFTYIYPDIPDQKVSFGIGTRRTMELIKKDDSWVIKREWYLDPFEDVLEVPEELRQEAPNEIKSDLPTGIVDNTPSELEIESVNTKNKRRYDRVKAVEYADKYSGATFGSGNDYKYNKKYRDFTGIGGDCSNFTSQVLADPDEGGGLRMDGAWHYSFGYKGVGGGTQAWVRALSLKDYLLYSGKAKLIARGTLEQVMEPTSKYPEGAFKALDLGDLVAYEDKKNIDHFSVVTGFDPKGLPLVNSHTTDRYKVPWDLGWSGKKIKYWLLHIRD